METFLFDAAFFAVSAFVLLAGVLALVLPPATYAKLLRAWFHFFRVAQPAEAAPNTLVGAIARRGAGLVIAIVGLVLFSAALNRFNMSLLPVAAHPAKPLTEAPSASWQSLLVAMSMLGGGTFLLVDPAPLVRWTLRRFLVAPADSASVARKWSVGYRITGMLAIIAGIDALIAWLGRP